MIRARPQSGYYVRGRSARMLETPLVTTSPLPVDVGLTSRLLGVLRANEQPGMIPLGSALPAPALLLAPRLSRLYASVGRLPVHPQRSEPSGSDHSR